MSFDWPEWTVSELEKRNLLLVQDGNHGEYRPRKNEFSDEGVAFIRAADLGQRLVQFEKAEKINDIAFSRIRKGVGQDFDTILSTKGTVGKLAYVPPESPKFVCSPQTSFWRSLDHDFIIPAFLYYELQSRYFINQISSRKGETDMADYLSLTSQRGLKIRVPDKENQLRVVKVLTSLDDKIQLNRQTNQTLEHIAQALFKSWFIDFEPTRAKISAKQAGQDPERAAMAAISGKTLAELDQLDAVQLAQLKTTAALFPDGVVESELGEVPEGWEMKPLYETAEYINGSAFKTKDFSGSQEGLPIVKIVELKNGITQSTKFTTGQFKEKYSITSGDILYSWSGSPETSLEVFKWFGGSAWLNQHIFKLNFTSTAQKHFAYFLLKQMKPVLIATAKQKQTTGLGHITVADMKRLLVAYPNYEVLTAFSGLVKPIYDKSSSLDMEIIELTNLRDTLLPKLLSGELSPTSTEAA